MSCEKGKDQICRATGAKYGLTGAAGNNVATTAWTSPMIARAQPGTTFDDRYEAFLAGKGMQRDRIAKIMNRRRAFTEHAFSRGWQGQCIALQTSSGSKNLWRIGNGSTYSRATKTQIDYLNFLYRGQNIRNNSVCNVLNWSHGPMVVLNNPDPEYPYLAVHTESGEGYLLSDDVYDIDNDNLKHSNLHTECLLHLDADAALETCTFFGIPVSQDAEAITNHCKTTQSVAAEPTQAVLIATDQNGEWVTSKIAKPQEAGFEIVGAEMHHSCGGQVEAATRRVKYDDVISFQTICRCRKCDMIIILGKS